jgi:hypothetical protein
MTRSVVLLATLHEFQGLARHPDSVNNDPSYASGVESFIRSGRADFVFEEAAGLGPSIAEQCANLILGPGHYLDMDSGRDKSNLLGGPKPICGFTSISVGLSKAREDAWFQRVNAQGFEKGLIICGAAHSLSFGFRLQSAGISFELCQHLPYEKMCKRLHAK